MSDENNVSNETIPSPNYDRVTAEDLFAALDNENALTSHRAEVEEKEKVKADAEEPVETGENEETKLDSQEETPSETDVEKIDWEEKFKDMEQSMNKRLKDTQAYAHKATQASQKVLEKVSKGEQLTEEDLKSLVTEEPESPNAVAQMVADVNESLPIAKSVVAQVSGRDMEAIEADIEAFNQLATVDPTLVQQLVETPVNDRAAFVIKRGGELKEVFDIVKENGGSVTAAVANSASVSTRAKNKLRGEIEAEVKKEYEEQYKDYVSSTVSKPKIRGTAPAKPNSSENAVDYGKIEGSDLFG